jgi:hypothetical protein
MQCVDQAAQLWGNDGDHANAGADADITTDPHLNANANMTAINEAAELWKADEDDPHAHYEQPTGADEVAELWKETEEATDADAADIHNPNPADIDAVVKLIDTAAKLWGDDEHDAAVYAASLDTADADITHANQAAELWEDDDDIIAATDSAVPDSHPQDLIQQLTCGVMVTPPMPMP